MNTATPTIINNLSDQDLLLRFEKLVQTERKITHLVLEGIAEIDARKLYLAQAYPSLYEFLVKKHGYSPSAAMRRISGARLLREVPEISTQIEEGALNLSQLSQVQQAVRTVQKLEDRKVDVIEKRELLNKIANANQEKTELILAQELQLPPMSEEKSRQHRDESVTLTMTFTKEQMAILEQVQNLISHSVPDKKWTEVMVYLAQREIRRRTVVRDTKKASTHQKPKTAPPINHAPLQASIKKRVINSSPCCQYRNPQTGQICGSQRFLQVDHKHSRWLGGSNSLDNLQVLCGEHNQHKYKKEVLETRYL